MKNHFYNSHSQSSKFVVGAFLVAFGSVFFLKQLGTILPDWIFKWPMILIIVGLITGAKHQYRYDQGWLIITLIGFIFLTKYIFPDLHIVRFIWPVAIITAGVWIIFGKQSFRREKKDKPYYYSSLEDDETDHATDSTEERLDDVVVFGAIKKTILSKNFRGGEAVAIFGGVELNLVNAEIPNRMELEITQIFGGTKLIIPSNWEVVSEVVTIFGGMEDKRRRLNGSFDKTLVLQGTSIFGGIEIHTYA
ncbi:DUF5668 domain-containing protein [Cytophagaceae bacterium DM2B3-1]|uniref:DUF5668 domain-containing protein n=2 Tax=Xanthocytophaga TaxID=3078918 RepID=A0ABT7CJI2_9BACT|nr:MULTISPECIES: DUF5668 domain-containing protein [Xanthocytophaga]MDJ1493893.1 DUF5668 domain-containing protein [Xanthocytophaga flavus]MDJ1501438.1 DUF5668 domain-containing protein [Xanthocytophaga agilis]